MTFRRFIATCLLVLFCIGTVHAASMGIAMQLPAQQDAAMHCHDMDGADSHGDSHAKPHHGNACQSCTACAPMMAGGVGAMSAFEISPTQNSHREASFASYVGKLPHRPPIVL